MEDSMRPEIERELIAAWEQEERQPLVGWDFSYLSGRVHDDPLPWSYPQRAAELLRRSQSALDIDTGGGELLLALHPYWPPKLVAAESYPPNLALARERLIPLGAQVVEASSDETLVLPFADASFDLVLDRHGGLPVAEIARILTPGGTLLTQQVHGLTMLDMLTHFGARPQWPDATPAYYLPQIADAGLTLVELREHSGWTTFSDVGALVYYLRMIPWFVPNFSVVAYTPQLLALHEQLEHGQPLRFGNGFYLIEARKPLA
jgi:SAM-dependent methyltransferase